MHERKHEHVHERERNLEQDATAEARQEPQQEQRHEQAKRWPSPRIYVASLGDYNAGTLHGEWIDAAQEPAAIYAEIKTMLDASEEEDAEEFAIHDYEGFGSMRVREYESIDWIARVAQGIAEHGTAFGHWAAHCQTEIGHSERQATLERFEESYMGVWESETAYAESLLDDYGVDTMLDEAVPSGLRHFIKVDYNAFAAELFTELWAVRDEEGVHVYSVNS
jgi:antirestriction protein